MNFIYELPLEVSEFLKDCQLSEIKIGCSDSQVIKIIKKKKIYFLKIAKPDSLIKEYNALKWLDGKLKVPKIIEFIKNGVGEFLITEAINGEMLCSEYYLSNTKLAIPIIADAIKTIHQIEKKDCPFNVSLNYKIDLVSNNIKNGLILEENIKSEILKKHGSIDGIYNYIIENKFEEDLCFSHGDTSLINIFAEDGKFSGFIDVGECGIADKWFDLAICQKSINRNFGKEYVDMFYKELDIIPDVNKINYYITLMELYL